MTSRFDIVDYLDDEQVIGEYLTQVLEDGDNDEFIRALGYVARARGMSEVAQRSGLGRENLYNALQGGRKPRFDTVLRVLHALDLALVCRAR
ncbi:putative addiction module antidote protein [Pasteurellaceae bacterium 20609_3]|uniref:addiction module antidote protein n=1 Tax=Spirabiliibacterium mucosae TaxID=28156 RepID=UPI001AACB97F|nr:addiction module antidote protein [Spirabiliibacterium mucosae]MBE2899215.1 putative addiction module antidote protein [Spirabiliibacterium mucosae]